ncbi:MAG: DciA family protein [Candidatus Thiodiazotropha sp.]|jgi:hypothetical protein
MESVSRIAASGSIFNRLKKQLSVHEALLQQLRQLLPPPLDSQLKTVALQHGNLTLFVPSPVWASRFRYLLPQLQNQLLISGIQVAKVRTSILPNESTKPLKTKMRSRPMINQAASKQMRELAKTINDPFLRDALIRLSQHTEHS